MVMNLLRRISTSLPRGLECTRRNFKSIKIPGESLDSPTARTLVHGIHVFHCQDSVGIVAKLSDRIASRGGSILVADVCVLKMRMCSIPEVNLSSVLPQLLRVEMDGDFLKLSKTFNAMWSDKVFNITGLSSQLLMLS